MSSFSISNSKRKARRLLSSGEVHIFTLGRGRSGGSRTAGIQVSTKGRHEFTTPSLGSFLLLRTEVARAETVRDQMRRAVKTALARVRVTRETKSEGGLLFVTVAASTPCALTSSPPFTGMLIEFACFPPSITSCVPYLLTSLHVTTSTAIRAVDDNQSC